MQQHDEASLGRRMNKFEVVSKLWPSGELLNGGVDINTVNPPGQGFTRTAPPLAGTVSAPNGYRFLFWNTGRRVTNKYQVTWTFNALTTWTTWTATRWYGVSGIGGGGEPEAHDGDGFRNRGRRLVTRYAD
jgi:hypothetical protein